MSDFKEARLIDMQLHDWLTALKKHLTSEFALVVVALPSGFHVTAVGDEHGPHIDEYHSLAHKISELVANESGGDQEVLFDAHAKETKQ